MNMHGSDLMKLFSAGASSIAGRSQLILRTNVTPDITINIDSLMKAKAGGPQPKGAISSDDEMVLKFLQPEVVLRVKGGNKVTYAPYGKPRSEYLIIFFVVLVLSGLLGAKISWDMCKKH